MITDNPDYLVRYKAKYCPECLSLVFNYDNVGDICHCKNPWDFSSSYWERHAAIDPTRLLWKEVWVELYEIP